MHIGGRLVDSKQQPCLSLRWTVDYYNLQSPPWATTGRKAGGASRQVEQVTAIGNFTHLDDSHEQIPTCVASSWFAVVLVTASNVLAHRLSQGGLLPVMIDHRPECDRIFVSK